LQNIIKTDCPVSNVESYSSKYKPEKPTNQWAWFGRPPMIPTDCLNVKQVWQHCTTNDNVATKSIQNVAVRLKKPLQQNTTMKQYEE